MSFYQESRNLTREFYSDGKVHSIKEVRTMLAENGIIEPKNGNMISNVLYQLKKEGYIKMCEEKGDYVLTQNESGTDASPKAENKPKAESRPNAENKLKAGENTHFAGEAESGKLNVDMDKFILIKPQSPRHTELRVTILEAGEIRMNVALQKRIGSRKIQVLLSRDSRTMLLHPGGEDAMEFTKAGTAKNREIVDILKRLKLSFPIIYNVRWSESYHAWEGTLNVSEKK